MFKVFLVFLRASAMSVLALYSDSFSAHITFTIISTTSCLCFCIWADSLEKCCSTLAIRCVSSPVDPVSLSMLWSKLPMSCKIEQNVTMCMTQWMNVQIIFSIGTYLQTVYYYLIYLQTLLILTTAVLVSLLNVSSTLGEIWFNSS